MPAQKFKYLNALVLVTYCAKTLFVFSEEGFAYSYTSSIFGRRLTAPAFELPHKIVFVSVTAFHGNFLYGKVC